MSYLRVEFSSFPQDLQGSGATELADGLPLGCQGGDGHPAGGHDSHVGKPSSGLTSLPPRGACRVSVCLNFGLILCFGLLLAGWHPLVAG